MAKLTIRQWPVALDVQADTVLNAALSAGVPYPHGCRIGECGFCKSQLVSGEVSMSSYDEAVLSAREREEGLILACRAKPRSDVEIVWLSRSAGAAIPVQRLRAQVTNIEAVSADIRRLYVWPERQLNFAAGQFARLGFGDIEPRSYSMANRPDDPVLEFHVRLLPGGAASAYVANALKPGATIRLEGPFGEAHLRADHRGPLIAVAGGTGLAPIKSIVKTALHAGLAVPVRVLFAARSERHVYDRGDLLDLCSRHPNLGYDVVFSRGGDGQPDLRPLLAATARAAHELPGAKLFTAGPPDMVKAVAAAAREAGLPEADVFSDAFFSSGQPAPPTFVKRVQDRLQKRPGRRWRPLARLFGAA